MMMLKVLVKKSTFRAATAGGAKTHLHRLNHDFSQRFYSSDN